MYSIACIENKTIIGSINDPNTYPAFMKNIEKNDNLVIYDNNINDIAEQQKEGEYLFHDANTKIIFGSVKKIENNSYLKYFYGSDTRNELTVIRTYELFKNKNEEINEINEKNFVYEKNEFDVKYCNYCQQYDEYLKSYDELNKNYAEFYENKIVEKKIYNFNLFEDADYKEYSFSYIVGTDNINKTETAVSIVDMIMNKYDINNIYLYETNEELYNIWKDVFRNYNINSINDKLDISIKKMLDNDTNNKIVVIHLDNDKFVRNEFLLSLMVSYYENNINLVIIVDAPYRFNKLVQMCINYVIVHNDINNNYVEDLYYSIVPQHKISFDEFSLNLSINDKLIIDKDKSLIYNGF